MNRLPASGFLTGVFPALLLAGCSHAPDGGGEAAPAVRPPGGGLTAEARPGSGLYAVRGGDSVVIRFRHAGPGPVSVLKPLDGSADGQHMPYYRLGVRDGDGRPLERARGCGNCEGLWYETRWPQDYLVEIGPGATFDVELALPFGVKRDGPHTVSFEYVYEPTNEDFAPPPAAWRGSVKAAETVVDLKK